MNFEKIKQAMAVINSAQGNVWLLHHKVKASDEDTGTKLWECSLQIEHALLVLNEEILKGAGYFEEGRVI
jgi:hypothetical protein